MRLLEAYCVLGTLLPGDPGAGEGAVGEDVPVAPGLPNVLDGPNVFDGANVLGIPAPLPEGEIPAGVPATWPINACGLYGPCSS